MNYDTIAKLHATFLDREEEMRAYINSIAGVKHIYAEQTRLKWQEELEAIQADKADFLQLVGSDPIEAVKKYAIYLLPENLRVKHAIESL